MEQLLPLYKILSMYPRASNKAAAGRKHKSKPMKLVIATFFCKLFLPLFFHMQLSENEF